MQDESMLTRRIRAVEDTAPLRSEPAPAPGTIFRPGRNAWRVAKADRAAVLIDAAAYYGTLRQALLQARQSIYIIGWDVDSRTPLVGPSGEPDDDLPRELGPFLTALVERRPELKIYILLWDYSLFFTSERQAMPAFALRWKTPPQIDLCLRCDPARLVASSEDRRARRGPGLFRRPRPHHPALGHLRSRSDLPLPGRSRGQAV